MAINSSRRNFLKASPLAAAALPFAESILFAPDVRAADGQGATPEPFQVFTAEKLADATNVIEAQRGQHPFYESKAVPLTVALFSQETHASKEFEYHEGRDHVFLILDGATTFELGGTPKDARMTKPGEWLAASSDGSTSVALKKGDMLVVPRGTPHRQSTEKSATWMLISSSGAVKA
jgi:quercetin dioxygenase-like cupin family protein